MDPAGRGEPMYEHVSTGRLPSSETIAALVADAHDRFGSNSDGVNSTVYPALAEVPSELFGVCLIGVSGNEYTAGDTAYEFSIMSVSKPFVFALVTAELGPQRVKEVVGVNATGRSGGKQEYLVHVTPEPETYLLMATGMLALFVGYRRRGRLGGPGPHPLPQAGRRARRVLAAHGLEPAGGASVPVGRHRPSIDAD